MNTVEDLLVPEQPEKERVEKSSAMKRSTNIEQQQSFNLSNIFFYVPIASTLKMWSSMS